MHHDYTPEKFGPAKDEPVRIELSLMSALEVVHSLLASNVSNTRFLARAIVNDVITSLNENAQ